MKNIVFDIQRASLQDGPGIRTTVFLKGCPLRCLWCHNPESHAFKPELGYDATTCIGCRACADACTREVHQFSDKALHLVHFDRCTTTGHCLAVCPSGTLRHYGYTMETRQIMQEVLKDRVYYESSGGGLTLSGGEPTLQARFCLELLQAAKKEGIHTCLETCGFAELKTYRTLLPWTDIILFDYKASDPVLHRRLTGVDNQRILQNLDWLLSQRAKLILRCPLIPGLNDDEAHLRSIAEMRRKHPLLGVELMPYHSSGNVKYVRTGRSEPALGSLEIDEKIKRRWLDLTGVPC